MEHESEDDHGCTTQTQNIHDLQNYLVTFSKEIEGRDDVTLSSVGVDSGVGDLYNHSNNASLQEASDHGDGVQAQFSAGFYTEQGMLDGTLADDSGQQIQSLVNAGDSEMGVIKQEIDMDSVQAQIAGFGDTSLSQGTLDIQDGTMGQGLIMTSLGDNLDPNGKVIRILSLGEDGQFLPIGDSQQMQILNQDTLSMMSLTSSENQTLRLTDSLNVNTSTSSDPQVLTDCQLKNLLSVSVGQQDTKDLLNLQSTSEMSQAQLMPLTDGTSVFSPNLHMTSLLSGANVMAGEGLGEDLGYRTITIMPTVNQGSDMNYVLVMGPQGQTPNNHIGQSFQAPYNKNTHIGQSFQAPYNKKNQELSEELVEINGEVKRVFRVVPKKIGTPLDPNSELSCNFCNYTSPKRYLLSRHMKTHSEERPFKCTKCDRGFKTPASLMNHVNTHTGTRPHKCKTCEAAFTTSGELVRHIRYRHTFEKPHHCPNCDYASVELSKLKRHMRSHTGERPYKCQHCPYASPDTYKLKRHLRIHTGEKPYECDVCHARFTQSNSLKAHKLIHSGNKPVFQCTHCPTTCGRRTDLKIHFNKLHTVGSPLECKKCGKVFSDRYSYKQHSRTHDVDRCFRCDHCDFLANTEKVLESHAAIHVKEKLKCDLCGDEFNLSQTLEKHKQYCSGSSESIISASKKRKDKQLFSVSDQESASEDYRSADEKKLKVVKLTKVKDPQTSKPQVVSSSGTLHRNILEDMQAGKLGNTPQVVIVHPDGSLEEISSKLPGSKLNLEEILSTLSTTDKSGSKGRFLASKESPEKDKMGTEGYRSQPSQTTVSTQSVTSSGDKITMQCEAGTQAEIESDTDSADGDDNTTDAMGKDLCSNEESRQTKPVLDYHSQPMPSASTTITVTLTPDVIPTDSSLVVVPSASLPLTTDSNPSLNMPLLSLLPPGPSHESPSTISPVEKDIAGASQPQYAFIKGYTYMGENTDQPTLVNLAVDRDSVMKLFMTLGQQASTAQSNDAGNSFITDGGFGQFPTISLTEDGLASIPLTSVSIASDNSEVMHFEGENKSVHALDTSNIMVKEEECGSSRLTNLNQLECDRKNENEEDALEICINDTPETINTDTEKEFLVFEKDQTQLLEIEDDQQNLATSHIEESHPMTMAIKIKAHSIEDDKTKQNKMNSLSDMSTVFTSNDNDDDKDLDSQWEPPQDSKEPKLKKEIFEPSVSTHITVKEDLEDSAKKRSNRKRLTADPSLVIRGKRVRKALVKVSL